MFITTRVLLAVIIALFVVAFIEGVVIYIKQMEVWHLKNRLFEMSGLEPVLWEDDEWERQ